MNILKFIILLLLISQAQAATTISCPTVADIKNHQLHDWLPLYKDNEELASGADIGKFIQAVTKFDVAWWQPLYLEAGHCVYLGTDSITDQIVLAHDAWRPMASLSWHWITQDKLAECKPEDSSPKDCGFIA